MRTIHKLTHRPLARRLLTLVFLVGLGALGWQLPSMGSAALAYSNQAYTSFSSLAAHAYQALPGAKTSAAKTVAAPVLNPAMLQGLAPATAKLLGNLYGQSQYDGEFAQEELYVLGRLGKADAAPITQLEADTVLSRVLSSVYVTKAGITRAQSGLLVAYRAAVTAAGRTILDESNPNPGKGGGAGLRGKVEAASKAAPTATKAVASPNVAIIAPFAEGFDDVTTLPGAGWSQQNLSSPLGTSNWFQGNDTVFPAQAGAATAYIGANFNNTGDVGTISNWLLTPEVALKNGDQFKFWTRKPTVTTDFPDRLEVRLSTAGASTNVGATATSVGDFTTVLLTINPTLVTGVYPQVWTQFTVTVSGLGAATTGRLGFRYFVTNAGLNGSNSDFIGIDTFEYAPVLSLATPVADGATLTAESCGPTNTVADPGETVTFSFGIKNTGGAPNNITATLLQDGLNGVINPSAAQNYGSIATNATVTKDFTFTVPSNFACGGTIVAKLNVTDNGTPLGMLTYSIPVGTTNAPTTVQTFTQNTPVTLPADPPGGGTATPYPSALTVAGVTGTVVGVKVKLNSVSHTFPDDMDILLVGPTGAGVVLMSDAGGGTDLVNTNFTFADGSPYLPDSATLLAGGTFAPTNHGTGDVFAAPAPAPIPAGGSLNSLFAGQNPNGVWNLFVTDQFTGDTGSITSWSLELTTTTVTPTIASTPFSNTTAINLPADPPGSGAATPYPSNITVSGVAGQIINIAVTLNGLSHTFPNDVDIMLVGPTGVGYTVLSDVGGGAPGLSSVMVKLQDSATPITTTTGSLTTGTFRPTNSGATDTFPAPAPATFQNPPTAGVASLLGTYGALNPNGTWSLYLVDDLGGDTGAISGGWTLTFTTINYPTSCSACPTCTVTAPANLTVSNDPNLCSAVVNYAAPNTAGTCGLVTCTPASGSTFPKGVTTVTCTSATGGGFATFTVTVNDTQLPAITPPANITANVAAGTCAATVTYAAPVVADNCPGVGTPVCTPASGSSFPKGVTTVNCTVTDAVGNTNAASFTVTVIDNIPPTLTQPANIFVGTAGTTAVVTYTNPTPADNCPFTAGNGVVTCTPASNSAFPVGVTTVNCFVTDAAGLSATTSFTVTVNKINPGSLTDPLECTGPGNVLTGFFSVTNNGAGTQTVAASSTTANPPNNLLFLPGTCVVTPAAAGTCTIVNNNLVTFTGSLTAGQTATITYKLQVNDGTPAGTPVCTNVSASFSGGATATASACITPNCPLAGPGNPFITQGPERQVMSDQRPGSVLIYPIYTSDAVGGGTQNARVSITNTSTALKSYVHLFFVDGATCSVSDAYICLTPNQTSSFLTSDLDPGTTGYLVAIATDANGCPQHFNYLIGDEYVKFASGHRANLAAEAIPAIAGSGFFAACDGTQPTATLRFNGADYGWTPYTLAADSIPSTADGNNSLLIINRIGGDLQTGPARLGPIFGVLYDDAEISYSFNLPTSNLCQFRGTLSDSLPRTTPRLSQVVPAGRTGWMKFAGTSEMGIVGALINYNSNVSSSSGAFNGGRNLHKLTFTNTMVYTIPLFPPTC